MNTLEYRLEDKQTIKTFEEISSLETSVRFFVNYWVNEGKVYENRANYFTNGKLLLICMNARVNSHMLTLLKKYRTQLNTVCFIQIERYLKNLPKQA